MKKIISTFAVLISIGLVFAVNAQQNQQKSIKFAQSTTSNQVQDEDKPANPANQKQTVTYLFAIKLDLPKQSDAAPSPMNFSEAMLTVMALGINDLTTDQAVKIVNFFGDGSDTAPHVFVLKNMVYLKAMRDGAIPKGTELGAVNWQTLLSFLQGMLPTIRVVINNQLS